MQVHGPSLPYCTALHCTTMHRTVLQEQISTCYRNLESVFAYLKRMQVRPV